MSTLEKLSNLAKYVNLLRLHEGMQHFEQLPSYESVQNQLAVKVDGDATQLDVEHQAEPQQSNPQPIGRTTRPQSTRPLVIQIERRPILPNENKNRHMCCGTSLQSSRSKCVRGV